MMSPEVQVAVRLTGFFFVVGPNQTLQQLLKKLTSEFTLFFWERGYRAG